MIASSHPVSSRLHGKPTAEVIVANTVTEITLGIDVSKAELVICDWDSGEIIKLENEGSIIKAAFTNLIHTLKEIKKRLQ